MILETSRLILRPWKESDAESLYEYAKNPLVGPAAGWPVHTSVENSRQIIREVLSADETYAVTVKYDNTAIGSVGLMIGDKSDLNINADEAEIGYWIGEPYWGRGFIPEAAPELMRYAFDVLNISAIWCGYFDGNEKSKKVSEKCGFRFHHTEFGKEWPLIKATKTQHVTCITKKDWSRIREITPADHPVLEDFLYNAVFIPEGEKMPPREIIFEPEIHVYIKDFGAESDCGVVAEQDGVIIGAAWTRIIPAYGHIDNETPELAISVLSEYRGQNIGTKMMDKLFELLRKRGYKRTSLSVQQNNPAVNFYKRLGYKITDEKLDHAGHKDYTMVKDLLGGN